MLHIVRYRRTLSSIMVNLINQENLDQALALLAGRLDLAQSEPVRLVVELLTQLGHESVAKTI